jgi:hypothetical protein
VCHPEWSPDGVLHFVSDRSGWWNLYAERRSLVYPLVPMEAEFGVPHWVFGNPRYAFLSDARVACIYSKNGLDHLAVVNFDSSMETVETPYTFFGEIRSDGKNRITFIAASPSIPPRLSRGISPNLLPGFEIQPERRFGSGVHFEAGIDRVPQFCREDVFCFVLSAGKSAVHQPG